MKMLHLVATIILAIGSANVAHQDQQPDTVRVLFIGSSYTYYNNLPGMLEDLARTRSNGPFIEAEMVVEGGATLLEHAESERTLEAIRRGGWDVVVLQSQSTFGSVYLVDGRFRIGDPSGFYRGARALAAEVETTGARTVLLQHWKRSDAPSRDGQSIAFSFMQIGRELRATVAPVGLAWEEVLASESSGVDLYAGDGSHPAPGGSYLAAAVLYEILSGESPVGLPGEVRGPPVDVSSEVLVPDSTAVLARLAADQARALQTAAHAVVERVQSAGGYLNLEDPGPPETPELPEGSPVDLAQLDERWSGPVTVYPYPGTLALTVSRDGGEWSLEAEVRFGGQPDDITVDVEDVSVTSEGIGFVDPNGPNGGEVRYRGVWTEEGLSGIAEIIVPGAPIYGIGTWTLKQQAVGSQPEGPTASNTPVAAPQPVAASPFGTPAGAGVGNP